MRGRRTLAPLILLVALFATSCSRAPSITVLNATAATIEIAHVLGSESRTGEPVGSKSWSWPWTWRFLIQPGEQRVMAYVWYRQFEIDIVSEGCRHHYAVPWPDDAHDDMTLRLDADFTLHWTNPGPNDQLLVAVGESAEPAGFPVLESTTTCGPAVAR